MLWVHRPSPIGQRSSAFTTPHQLVPGGGDMRKIGLTLLAVVMVAGRAGCPFKDYDDEETISIAQSMGRSE